MRVREVYAPTRQIVRESERDRLTRQLRRAQERNSRAFDEGFAAAVSMIEHGADLQQLRCATGVVSAEWCDPVPISFEDEPTNVD